MNPEFYFPLQNFRKTLDDLWDLEYIIEYRTIPTSSPYLIRLKEIPDNGDIINSPVISGSTTTFTETTSSPAPGEYLIKYVTGNILFNSDNAGEEIKISYYGKGSGISADDINYLKSLIDNNYHHSVSSNKIFNGTSNIPPSGNVDIYHNLNTEDLMVQVQYKSSNYGGNWVNGRAVLGFSIEDSNKIKITNNSSEIILSSDWRILISIFNTPIFYNSEIIYNNGNYKDFIHNLGSSDISFQIQFLPDSGPYYNKWIDGENILSGVILDENTIRVYNNNSILIYPNKCRILISMF